MTRWASALLFVAGCSMSQEYVTDAGADLGVDAAALLPDLVDEGSARDVGAPPSDLGIPVPPSDLGIPVPPSGVVICGGVTCATGQLCCFTTLTCVAPSSSSCAAPLVDAGVPDGAMTAPISCASNADCASTDYCDLYVGGPSFAHCGGDGICVHRPSPSDCGFDPRGACGCDGRTYPSTCEANAQGVRVTWHARCGAVVFPDSGSTSACDAAHPCPSASYHCDLGTEQCVANDPITACSTDASCAPGRSCCEVLGLCLPTDRPDLCRTPPVDTVLPCRDDADCRVVDDAPDGSGGHYFCGGIVSCDAPGGCTTRSGDPCGGEVVQVCGCDGMTYTNACWAYAALVGVAHEGACP